MQTAFNLHNSSIDTYVSKNEVFVGCVPSCAIVQIMIRTGYCETLFFSFQINFLVFRTNSKQKFFWWAIEYDA